MGFEDLSTTFHLGVLILTYSFCCSFFSTPFYFIQIFGLKLCHRNLISGDGSMSVCLVDLTREVVQKGGNATTVIYGIMDLIHVLEHTFLGSLVLGSKAAQQ